MSNYDGLDEPDDGRLFSLADAMAAGATTKQSKSQFERLQREEEERLQKEAELSESETILLRQQEALFIEQAIAEKMKEDEIKRAWDLE